LRALAALGEARERFLDLPRLIELATLDQQRLQQVLDPEDPELAVEIAANRLELLPALRETQTRNLARAQRLGELIAEQREALPPASATSAGADEQAHAQAEQARERLELADQILLVTASSMEGVATGLGDVQRDDWGPAVLAGEQAVRGLENLRRLFFSLIELLRDTAGRQLELADETDAVAALEADDRARRLGPLPARQGELAEITGAIANALEEQSRQQPGDLVAGVDPTAAADEQQLAAQAEALRRAAELVLAAQIEMEDGSEKLEAEPADFAQARVHQEQAVKQLLEALELLAPPQQDPQQDQEQTQDQQQEQAPQQGQSQEPDPAQAQPRPEDMDPSQLLQEVRDREAERRRENTERDGRGFDTVERDW